MPGMCPFHHPPPRWVPPPGTRRRLNRSTPLEVEDVVALPHPGDDILIIIALVEAEMVQAVDHLFRARRLERVERRERDGLVVGVGPGDHHRERGAPSVGQDAPPGPGFATIDRAWPRRL